MITFPCSRSASSFTLIPAECFTVLAKSGIKEEFLSNIVLYLQKVHIFNSFLGDHFSAFNLFHCQLHLKFEEINDFPVENFACNYNPMICQIRVI